VQLLYKGANLKETSGGSISDFEFLVFFARENGCQAASNIPDGLKTNRN
jgi:hypothetical protein